MQLCDRLCFLHQYWKQTTIAPPSAGTIKLCLVPYQIHCAYKRSMTTLRVGFHALTLVNLSPIAVWSKDSDTFWSTNDAWIQKWRESLWCSACHAAAAANHLLLWPAHPSLLGGATLVALTWHPSLTTTYELSLTTFISFFTAGDIIDWLHNTTTEPD